MNDQTKNIHAVELGRLGGAAGRGASKRRTAQQCSRASLTRWARVRAKKEIETKQAVPVAAN